MAGRKGMPEKEYRIARLFRVLGNPTAYRIVKLLERGRLTPGAISAELNIPIWTISMTLRNLRQVDLVRYHRKGKSKIYWLKFPEILALLKKMEKAGEAMRFLKY